MERSILPTVPMRPSFKHPLITIWKHVLVQLLLESAAWQSKWVGLALCPSSRARHVGSLTTRNPGVLTGVEPAYGIWKLLTQGLQWRRGLARRLPGDGWESGPAWSWQLFPDRRIILPSFSKKTVEGNLDAEHPDPDMQAVFGVCTQVLDRAAGWTKATRACSLLKCEGCRNP